jgi:PhoPQ-activated pathogenicity-related protein
MLPSRLTLVNCSHVLSLKLSGDINSMVGQMNMVFSNKEKILKLILTLQMIATNTATNVYTYLCVFVSRMYICSFVWCHVYMDIGQK